MKSVDERNMKGERVVLKDERGGKKAESETGGEARRRGDEDRRLVD